MGEILANTAAEQPIDELVGWVKQHDFYIKLNDRAFGFPDCNRCVE